MNRYPAVITVGIMIAVLSAAPGNVFGEDYMKGLSKDSPMVIDKEAKEIRLLAVLQPDAFSDRWLNWSAGHHAVVSKHGGRSDYALLAAFVHDKDFHDAMVTIGAEPGNNLTRDTWEERKNPNNSDPDKRVKGTPLDVTVWWEGLEKPVDLASLLVDPGDRGIDLRFGGHKHLIPVWRSGCVVCLQSCPGGKVSNHSYTMRDYAQGEATFTLNRSVVPEGTRKAVVIFRLRERAS